MTTFTGNTPAEPLAALSARVVRGGLRPLGDTRRWVQRAARQLRGTPSPSIGASIESFSAGIAERFPDVVARFAAPGEAAESYAAIDMPFVSAQGLVEMAQEETPAFESATAFLAHVRGTQPEVARSQPATSAEPRTTIRENTAAPANKTASPLEVMRERTAAARSSPASPAPLQRKAEQTTNDVRSKPARVVSSFEEIPHKNKVARTSLSSVTDATPPEMTKAEISKTAPQVEAQMSASSLEDANVVSPEDAPVAPPAMQRSETLAEDVSQVAETRSAPSEVSRPPAQGMQRKPADLRVVQQQDDAPQQHRAEVEHVTAPAIHRSARAKPVVAQTPQHEAASETHSEPAFLPAPMSDAVATSPALPSEDSNVTPLTQSVVNVASQRIQRRVDPPVPARPSRTPQTPALPLLRRVNAPQLARAGESAQQTSARIARTALPSLPLSNYTAATVDDASAAMERRDAFDGWPAFPAVAPAVPTMSEAMPAGPFAMPAFDLPSVPRNISAPSVRAALPQMPALPHLDMPFAQVRNAAQNIGAATQSQTSASFAALPSMPALPSLPSMQGAASQMQTSASAAMAGGVNAASSAVQSGVAGANQIATSAGSVAQGALGALTAGTPKTDLDRLARQLLPHLKRMLALERERMRPF